MAKPNFQACMRGQLKGAKGRKPKKTAAQRKFGAASKFCSRKVKAAKAKPRKGASRKRTARKRSSR